MKQEGIKKAATFRRWLIFYAAVIISCVALLIFSAAIHPVHVIGDSMYPTFCDGEILTTYELKDGEVPELNRVIVFNLTSSKKLIKRVVAVPGDTIEIIDGRLYRNGEIVEDGFPVMDYSGWITRECVVPEKCVFVLGDNRNNSSDSRTFGFVDVDSIFGVVDKSLFRP